MTHGDAFNDMPEEYREYVDEKDNRRVKFAEIPIEFATEADKAIAQGNLRWVLHVDMGWNLMALVGREKYGGESCLLYKEWQRKGETDVVEMMTESCVLEILPNGKTPPPAVPEKPIYTPDGLPALNRCPDCDNTLEHRSMPDGIEEWCSECNMKAEVDQPSEAEGPMHPDMIRAELQRVRRNLGIL